MKKPLTAVLVAAAAVATLAVPAGAAVPTTPAKLTVPCNDATGNSAKIWYRWQKPASPYASGITEFAAKNPCRQWLAIWYGGYYASSAPQEALYVAPGAHFNWGNKSPFFNQLSLSKPMGATLVSADSVCNGETGGTMVYSYKDVRTAPSCG